MAQGTSYRPDESTMAREHSSEHFRYKVPLHLLRGRGSNITLLTVTNKRKGKQKEIGTRDRSSRNQKTKNSRACLFGLNLNKEEPI